MPLGIDCNDMVLLPSLSGKKEIKSAINFSL